MSRNTTGGLLLFLAACALLAATVAADAGRARNDDAGGQNANAGGHGGGHGSGRRTADEKFVTFAATGGAAEVEMGRLAVQRGASEDVRQFGRRMVDDHTRAGEELTRVVSAKGIRPPATPDAKHQAATRKLSALSGERFDREYARMMIADHRKAVAEFQREADRGADPDIKAFAAAQLPTLREHLRMAQRLSDKITLRKSGHLKQ